MAIDSVKSIVNAPALVDLVEHASIPTLLIAADSGEVVAHSGSLDGPTLSEGDRVALRIAKASGPVVLSLGGDASVPFNVASLDLDGTPYWLVTAAQANEPLANEESAAASRFRALSDSVPVGIFLSNADGRVMYVNDRWTKITGLSNNEAVAKGWLEGIHAEDRQRIHRAWTQYLNQPGPFREEFRYRNGDTEVWVTARVTTFADPNGVRVGYLGSIVDISELKRAEDSLKESEKRYRTIFDNVLDVYYETSLTGEILEVSPSIELITDLKREKLIGQSMLGFYKKGEDREAFVNTLLERGGVLHDYEIDLTDRHGSRFSCAITCRLQRDEDGNPEKIIGSMRDITRRKAAEHMLQVERTHLELIARDAPLHEFLDNLVRSVERQAPDMLCSVLLLDLDGKRLRMGAAPSLPDAYNAAVDGQEIGPEVGCCGRAAATKACVLVDDIEHSPFWTDAAPPALEHGLRACWSQPIFDSKCEVLGTFAMYFRDVRSPDKHQRMLIQTASQLAGIAIERRRIEDERENLESQVRQAQKLESLGILAGGIAHDFNNLLTGIMGYASLAEHTLRSENSASLEHVERISSVAKRAANLTKQMLAYSGKGKFMVLPLNLSEAVEEMEHLFEISVSKKTRMQYRLAEDLPNVNADPAQIQQIAMNLVTNASEALGEESGEVTVSTGLVDADAAYLSHALGAANLEPGEYVFLEVSDTGCGMDDATFARIFDPFYTTKFTGRGLGMSAVLGIMRGHEGGIVVDSRPNEGTTIRVLFPSLGFNAASPKEWEGVTSDRTGWSGDGAVLIVDDEETVRNLAAKIFASEGFRVLTACDGEQALTIAAQNRESIDLVLMDITMPNKDGFETLQALRNSGAKVPVILSSGYNHDEMAERSTECGADGFLEKPYTRDMLIATVRKVVPSLAH